MSDETKSPSEQAPARDAKGRLLPGHTANPKGLRARMPDDVRDFLEAATMHGARRLVEALDAEKHVGIAATAVPDHDMRTRAWALLTERLWGKPTQSISGEEGKAFAGAIVFLPSQDRGGGDEP